MNDRILGHEWAAIQRAQQGRRLNATVDTSLPAAPAATDDDRAALAQHGADGLRTLGWWGVLDRLQQAGEL